MKVAFDVAQTCQTQAGCAWHADALARALARALPRGDLALYHQFGDFIPGSNARGVAIEGCEEPFRLLSREEGARAWREIEAGARPLPGRPDIVHSSSLMAPRTPGALLVYTVHDLIFWRRPELNSGRNRILCQEQTLRALARADAFHFISEATRREFETFFPDWLALTRKPWIVARSGPRHALGYDEARAARRFADRAAPWLFVGSIEPRKNLGALLDAYETYCERSPAPRPLSLVGAASWGSQETLDRVASMAARLPVGYAGYVEDEQLAARYRDAFALVLPSRAEGFGLTALEGLACALPCLCAPLDSVREFAGDAARFVDFDDTEQAAGAMLELEADADRYREASRRAAEAAAPYSWDRTAATLVDWYEHLLSTRALPAEARLSPA